MARVEESRSQSLCFHPSSTKALWPCVGRSTSLGLYLLTTKIRIYLILVRHVACTNEASLKWEPFMGQVKVLTSPVKRKMSGEGTQMRSAGPASFVGSHSCPTCCVALESSSLLRKIAPVCTPSETKQDSDGEEASPVQRVLEQGIPSWGLSL